MSKGKKSLVVFPDRTIRWILQMNGFKKSIDNIGRWKERLSALEHGKENPTLFEFEKIMWISDPFLS